MSNTIIFSLSWRVLIVDRFDSGQLNNIHTVNEHISVVNHIGMVKWFTLFVRNMDEAELED